MNGEPRAMRMINSIGELPWHPQPGEAYVVSGEALQEIVDKLAGVEQLKDAFSRLNLSPVEH